MKCALHLGAMGLGRRGTSLSDDGAWVFNKMADVYASRPAYPTALIDALVALTHERGECIADLGAGIGHLALPLSRRGLQVTAIEPARAMLEQLRQHARVHAVQLETVHATAEAIPIDDDSFDAVLIADALHFLDAELVGIEVARVLRPGGALAIVTSELADAPFMRALIALMEQAAPRRPRATHHAVAQLSALAGVQLGAPHTFVDHTPVDLDALQRIVRSISFIGPAMNAERFATFWRRVEQIDHAPVWSRSLQLHSGRRR